MQTKPPLLNPHRLARLIVLARAMIVWAAAVFFEGLIPSRRRIRQRYGMLSIDKLTHMVRNLMIARVGEMVRRNPSMRRARDHAPSGFRRRMRACNPLRSIGGARLRQFMKAGGDGQRFARLIAMMNAIDSYVRAFLLRRAENGVNRLLPLLVTHPPHDALRSLAAPAIAHTDTS